MKRLRIIGLALLALFALGALAASTASAVEGFLPLEKKGFTVLGKAALLLTHNKESIHCKKVSGTGKFTNDSEGSGTLDFDECAVLGFAITSLGDKESLILAPVTFKVCLINSAALTFGIAITVSPEIHLEAPAVGVLIKVKGTVIGEILTKEGKLFVIDFNGNEGLGNVKECGGIKHSLMSQKDPEAFLEASEKVTEGLMQFEETVKLMDT